MRVVGSLSPMPSTRAPGAFYEYRDFERLPGQARRQARKLSAAAKLLGLRRP